MEAHTVPHFKATINTKVWPEQLGSDGISISYKARPKIGHLLHKRGFVYSDMHTTVGQISSFDSFSKSWSKRHSFLTNFLKLTGSF